MFGILGTKSESNVCLYVIGSEFYLAAINTEWYEAAKPEAKKCETTTDEPRQKSIFLFYSGHYITST